MPFFNIIKGGRSKEMIVGTSHEITPMKFRVVVFGNNYDDRVYDVGDWALKWLEKEGLLEKCEVRVCKVRGAMEDAFFGIGDYSDTKSILALVMAGENIRDYELGGWTDFSIEHDLQRIKELCEQYDVPLVRFRFDQQTGQPQITSGSMRLADSRG